MRRWKYLVAALGLVLFGAGAAVAGHQFSDVPSGHPFHDEVSAMADAGITTGFADGTFRPSANVSRQAMAAFLGRGLGRATQVYADLGGGPVYLEEGSNELVGSAFMASGAADSGGGYVYVSGWATVETNDVADCPCEIQAYVVEKAFGTESVDGWFGYANLPGVAAEQGYSSVTMPFSAVFPIEAGTTHEYVIGVDLWDVDADVVDAWGTIEAIYVPFDGAGAGLGEPMPDVAGDATSPKGRR